MLLLIILNIRVFSAIQASPECGNLKYKVRFQSHFLFLHIQRKCINGFHFQFPRRESQPAETPATRTFFFLSSLCSFSARLVVLWLSLSLVICGCHWMSLVFIGCHSSLIVVTGCRLFSLIVSMTNSKISPLPVPETLPQLLGAFP